MPEDMAAIANRDGQPLCSCSAADYPLGGATVLGETVLTERSHRTTYAVIGQLDDNACTVRGAGSADAWSADPQRGGRHRHPAEPGP